MTDFRAALVDLDGTVWRGEQPIDGAAAGIAALRTAGVDIHFVTNSTSLRRSEFADRLAAVGIDRRDDAVITAASATADYLRRHRPDARVFVVGREALVEELDAADLSAIDAHDPGAVGTATVEEADGRDTADVVVAGNDESIDYPTLTRTLRAFGDDTDFVATNTDRTLPGEDGLVPGAGAIVGAIEGMTGREPLVCGKPSVTMADAVCERLGVDPEHCLVIGDNLQTDVLMGERAGMTTVLVLTGTTDRDAVGTEGIEPDHVIESLGGIDHLL